MNSGLERDSRTMMPDNTTAGRATPPVLLLAFNRPDTTARVLDAIRGARPARLYFAVDGPRPDRPGEREQVARVRGLAERIDWDCELETLFREDNLGCKVAVSQAIDWFFGEVEAGIVLEDDCVAHASFFPFAAELLERYRDDERIVLVSGNNFQQGVRRSPYSYYFSRFNHIWGWASWRRAWRLYDHAMTLWPEVRDGAWLHDLLGDRAAVKYWTRIFDHTHAERNTSWAYRWTFACWIHGGASILPAVNLVSNIGFDAQATHTRNRASRVAALPVEQMPFPLRHPPFLIRDARADASTEKLMFSGSRSLPALARAAWDRVARTWRPRQESGAAAKRGAQRR